MLSLAIVLLFVGAVFLIVEMFFPGFGFFGILGIISIVVSAVLTVIATPIGIFIVLAESVVLAIIIYAMFRYIKKTQLRGKLILDETLNFEKKEIGDLDYFLGKEGITKTTLKPFGTADFNGITMDVYSDGSFIKENKTIKVINVTGNKITVTEQNKN